MIERSPGHHLKGVSMSISGALNNAMSGLRAAGRASELVSSNISNALTPGYSSQTLNLSSGQYTPGVRIGDVERNTDPALQSTTRKAEAAHAKSGVYADFYAIMSGFVGTVDDSTSIFFYKISINAPLCFF